MSFGAGYFSCRALISFLTTENEDVKRIPLAGILEGEVTYMVST